LPVTHPDYYDQIANLKKMIACVKSA